MVVAVWLLITVAIPSGPSSAGVALPDGHGHMTMVNPPVATVAVFYSETECEAAAHARASIDYAVLCIAAKRVVHTP